MKSTHLQYSLRTGFLINNHQINMHACSSTILSQLYCVRDTVNRCSKSEGNILGLLLTTDVRTSVPYSWVNTLTYIQVAKYCHNSKPHPLQSS